MQLSERAREILQYDRHPQERTRLFHEIFDAPIRDRNPDFHFSHMDDQRAAFRLSFILSEAFEILEKGFGLKVSIAVGSPNPEQPAYKAHGSGNAGLCHAIQQAMADVGLEGRNVVEVVDGLGDLNVVVNGFGLELGADMRAVDREVLASNLTKLDEAGNPIVADGTDLRYPAGKILKGPNFMEPNIAGLLGLEPGAQPEAENGPAPTA